MTYATLIVVIKMETIRKTDTLKPDAGRMSPEGANEPAVRSNHLPASI